MLDDIIEAVIDIAGDILETVISSKRKKSPKQKRKTTAQTDDPWNCKKATPPWEK